jgi:acyl-CoA reductase-like NAD-dependent aldehyde dehydrogenase
MTINNDRIVQIAGLQVQLDQQGATAPAEVRAEFMQALGALATAREAELIGMAASLLAGEPYAIVGDNRETVAACRSLAAHMGASAGRPKSMEEYKAFAAQFGLDGDGDDMLVFTPAPGK